MRLYLVVDENALADLVREGIEGWEFPACLTDLRVVVDAGPRRWRWWLVAAGMAFAALSLVAVDIASGR